MIHIRVLGLASIAADVSPAGPGHDSWVEVLGAFRASRVKAALAPRTT